MLPTKCILPGCENAARPGGSTCSAAHRSALHRYRKATANALTPRERKRLRDREAARVKRAAGVPAMDMRLQWDRAVAELDDYLAGGDWKVGSMDSRDAAVAILKPALPKHLRDLV